MASTPAGSKGRGRGTGVKPIPTPGVSVAGISQPLPPQPPPEIEEQLRAQAEELKKEELRKHLNADINTASHPNDDEGDGCNMDLTAVAKDTVGGKPEMAGNAASGEEENREAMKKSDEAARPAQKTASAFQLNPACAEFVPWSLQKQPIIEATPIFLNPEAPEYLPSAPMNLPPAQEYPQISAYGMTISDMVLPFMAEVPNDELELLDLASELLLRCAACPEFFDNEMDLLLGRINHKKPHSITLSNMAALVIPWGETDSNLQYVASKLCAACFQPLRDKGFTKTLIDKIKSKFAESLATSELASVVQFSRFLAELYFRIRTEEDHPVHNLGDCLIELINKLLNSLPCDSELVAICNILKLTGMLLDSTDTRRAAMDGVVHTLSLVIKDSKLSSRTMVSQLLVLRENRWCASVSNVPLPATYIDSEDDTVYFVPKGVPNGVLPTKQQPPVANSDEWSDYIIEDDAIVNNDNNGALDVEILGEEDFEADFEADFEDFLQENTSHYAVQSHFHQ